MNLHNILLILKKPKIFVYTIIWLMILVVIGTLAQKDLGLFAVQEKYFSSWFFNFGFFPLPGGRLTILIIAINLSFFFFNKNLFKLNKIGILIIHIGAMLLILGAALTAFFSSEGNMVIKEGNKSNYVEDYHYMELSVINTSNPDYDLYTIFDHQLFNRNQKLTHSNIDFDITVIQYIKNCEPMQRSHSNNIQYKGMLKNIMLNEIPPLKEEHLNRPGIIFTISNANIEIDGIYGLFLGQAIPQTLKLNGIDYNLVFRKKRTYLPFEIELIDFKKIMHPGTNIAKSFSSEVNLIESDINRKILIKMNEPLRYKNYTFYQSSFIEEESGETSVFAVVENYGRLFPYISSIIMCFGLLLHLIIKLPFFKTKL